MMFITLTNWLSKALAKFRTYLLSGIFLDKVKRSSLLVIPVIFYLGKNLDSWSYDKMPSIQVPVGFWTRGSMGWSRFTLAYKSRLLNIEELWELVVKHNHHWKMDYINLKLNKMLITTVIITQNSLLSN